MQLQETPKSDRQVMNLKQTLYKASMELSILMTKQLSFPVKAMLVPAKSGPLKVEIHAKGEGLLKLATFSTSEGKMNADGSYELLVRMKFDGRELTIAKVHISNEGKVLKYLPWNKKNFATPVQEYS